MSTTNRCIALNQESCAIAAMELARRTRENILRERTKRGWSQTTLAKAVNPPTVYQQIDKLETGERRLTLEWVEKIAAAFGMDPIELQGGGKPVTLALGEQAGAEVARVLATVAREGEPPEPGTVQVLQVMLQELLLTFSEHPQAATDPTAARLTLDLLSRQYAPVAN